MYALCCATMRCAALRLAVHIFNLFCCYVYFRIVYSMFTRSPSLSQVFATCGAGALLSLGILNLLHDKNLVQSSLNNQISDN